MSHLTESLTERLTMSQVITPTIGRKLWYYPSDFDMSGQLSPDCVVSCPTMVSDQSQPCDANICYVHSDRLVNLSVVDHNGQLWSKTSVTLVQPGDPLPERGKVAYATWMPYQIEAALRHATPMPLPTTDPLSDTVDLVK